MKRLLAALLILVPLTGVSGQEHKRIRVADILVFGGAASSRYPNPSRYWEGPDFLYYTDPHGGFGSVAGLGFEIHLSKIMSVDFRLHYIRKGTDTDIFGMDWITMSSQLVWQLRYDLDTLGNSTSIKFKPLPKSFPYLLAGWEIAGILNHNMTSDAEREEANAESLMDTTRKVDFGFLFGIGIEIGTQRWKPFFEARYHLGLVDLNKGIFEFGVIRTQTLVLLGGIKIPLGKE